MIGIVDYGLSNLTSVAGAIEKLGYECVITDSADTLQRSRKLILPASVLSETASETYANAASPMP